MEDGDDDQITILDLVPDKESIPPEAHLSVPVCLVNERNREREVGQPSEGRQDPLARSPSGRRRPLGKPVNLRNELCESTLRKADTHRLAARRFASAASKRAIASSRE